MKQLTLLAEQEGRVG